MEKKIKFYKYTESGLDNVYLANGFNFRKTPYGDGVSIDNLDGLHKAIADHLINNRPKLNGPEFRFLRIEMDLSQKKLGNLIGVSEQTIALWEKHGNIQAYGDRLIRVIYKEWIGGNAEMIKLVDHLNTIDRHENKQKMFFQETKNGWIPKKAA